MANSDKREVRSTPLANEEILDSLVILEINYVRVGSWYFPCFPFERMYTSFLIMYQGVLYMYHSFFLNILGLCETHNRANLIKFSECKTCFSGGQESESDTIPYMQIEHHSSRSFAVLLE